MTPLAQKIVALIERSRLPLADEKALQTKLLILLGAAGFAALREVRLSDQDIVDFMVFDADSLLAGLAIEVKIKGQRRSIYKQLERYCSHPRVTEIILVTNVPMGLPETINGKPCAIANLGRGWL